MKSSFKLSIIIFFFITKSKSSIKDLCINLKDYEKSEVKTDFQKNLFQKEVLANTKKHIVSKTRNSYSVNKKKKNIKIKEYILENLNTENFLTKQIQNLKIYEDEKIFYKLYKCVYGKNPEYNGFSNFFVLKKFEDLEFSVYLLLEEFQDSFEKSGYLNFIHLSKERKIREYIKLLKTLKMFHEKNDILLEINPRNIKSTLPINSLNHFKLKFINYKNMTKKNTLITLEDNIFFKHPILYTNKKVKANFGMDLYSLFISIVYVEIGFKSIDLNKYCIGNYTDKCHFYLLRKIYNNYCEIYNLLYCNDEKFLEYNKNGVLCKNFICVVLKFLNFDLNSIPSIDVAINELQVIFVRLESGNDFSSEEERRIIL